MSNGTQIADSNFDGKKKLRWQYKFLDLTTEHIVSCIYEYDLLMIPGLS